MTEQIKLVSLDLDLTTIDANGALYDGLNEVIAPSVRDFPVAIMTGRGWPRFRQAIAENHALTPNAPVALEHGSRIVDSHGRNLHYEPLPPDVTDAVIDYIEKDPDELSSVSFYPRDTQAKTVTWSRVNPEELKLGAAYYKDTVFLRDKKALYQALRDEDLTPATVTCRVFEGRPTNIPDGLNYYSRGRNVNFLPPNASKGVAAPIMADITGIPLTQTLYAGNDKNDLPVLTLPDLGQPVLVGHDLHHEQKLLLPERTIFVSHHSQLGQVIFERTRPRQGGLQR